MIWTILQLFWMKIWFNLRINWELNKQMKWKMGIKFTHDAIEKYFFLHRTYAFKVYELAKKWLVYHSFLVDMQVSARKSNGQLFAFSFILGQHLHLIASISLQMRNCKLHKESRGEGNVTWLQICTNHLLKIVQRKTTEIVENTHCFSYSK